jgi:hypothetical protein
MTILPCELTTVESAKDATEAKLQRARPQELAVAGDCHVNRKFAGQMIMAITVPVPVL